MGRPEATHSQRVFSLPAIHCAGCIRGVEQTLAGLQGVSNARVNFSLKRVVVHADDAVSDADLLAALTDRGFEAYPLNSELLESDFDARGRALLWRIGLAGFAVMNVMLLSIAVWSGAPEATRDLFHWISAMIAIPVTVIAAQPFFASAWTALRGGRMNMDVPIALAVAMTVGMSLYETSLGGRHAYFDAALSLTFFLLIGRYLDHRMRRAARSAAKELTAMEPARVRVETPEGARDVPLAQVQVGDLLAIQAGGRLAVDGVLEDGDSLLDLSFITGEADPVPSRPGQVVTAGTIALTGPIKVRATAVGDDSTLRRLAALVEVAENARGKYRSLSDRAAATYAPGVHILAALAFIGWIWATGDLRLAFNIAVAVLIITCPCALGLAVPAVATNVTARLFKKGVILKSATALERLSEVDTIVFDKTGTLTRSAFDPVGLTPDMLPTLKALALASDHPLSQAVVAGLPDVEPAALDNVSEQAGFGVRAQLNGVPVAMGAGRAFGAEAQTVFWTQTEGAQPLTFSERPLDGAAEMIAALHARGYQTRLISGDSATRVTALAEALGIGSAAHGVSPEGKVDMVKALTGEGHRVLMVGDGLNDTAALASAHASIAPSSALEASRSAADAVLLGGDVTLIPEVLAEARTALARMQQNVFLAGLYNVIAVPVAAIGWVTPLVAAIAMSASSITVIANAMRKGRAQ
ncbi:heavy metal translocating P-type ATPase [Aliishimia ponticola]|uniref:Heavy metal translocating P-type ATPase n=2 Tax=Aliishimia ponticola TaxID=2499833 RepID=A0A4S4NAC1_9RHOB|nr:heavy metal translocating P-type ATPase [Aliishimia ponticola]